MVLREVAAEFFQQVDAKQVPAETRHVSMMTKDDVCTYRAEIASLRLYSVTLPRRCALPGALVGREPDSSEAKGSAATMPLSSPIVFGTGVALDPATVVALDPAVVAALGPAVVAALDSTDDIALDPGVDTLCVEPGSTRAATFL
jgi:hypothetical protein